MAWRCRRCSLFEVWGGWAPAVLDLVQRAAHERGNKLRAYEYDDTTWSARTWTAYTAQRVACALQRAVSYEIARSLQLTTARDPRAGGDGAE